MEVSEVQLKAKNKGQKPKAKSRFFTLPFIRLDCNRELGHVPTQLMWHSHQWLWTAFALDKEIKKKLELGKPKNNIFPEP